jgi:hypothetical protein
MSQGIVLAAQELSRLVASVFKQPSCHPALAKASHQGGGRDCSADDDAVVNGLECDVVTWSKARFFPQILRDHNLPL